MNLLKIRLVFAFTTVFLVSFTFGAMSQRVFSQNSSFIVNEIPRGGNIEKLSPQDWIKEDMITVYDDKVVIKLVNPQWAKFTDTNSMDPVLDQGSNAIEIIPLSPELIKPGDIISFDYSGDTIIHRVYDTGYDDFGWYALTKGDNNPNFDPEKVRFEKVKRVLVAVIY